MSDDTNSLPPAIETQQPKSKLWTALAKAQGEFIQPEKNKTAEIKKEGRLLYITHYADLKNVIESFRSALSKHGLSFTQKTRLSPRGWLLVLTLQHETGEFDETSMPIQLEQAPQQVGSQLTYLKRYQAAAYFGIAADDDDDANGAEGNEASFENKEKNKTPPKPQVKAPQAAKPKSQGPATNDKDPGEYVFLKGKADVKNKMIQELSEGKLREILKWGEGELKKGGPPGETFTIVTNIKAFFKDRGVLYETT